MSVPTENGSPARSRWGVVVIVIAVLGLLWLGSSLMKSFRPPPVDGGKVMGDPVKGLQVKLPATDMNGAPIKVAGDPVLLVALPGCTGCTKDEFDADKIDLGRYKTVLLLSAGRVLLSQIAAKNPGKEIVYIADSNDQTANSINATFKPRAYILSSDLKIQAVQGPKTTVAEFANSYQG
jgi:hypothetical protein